MHWLMFFRLKVSDAAAKIAISRDAGGQRAIEAGEVGNQRGVAGARPPGDAGENLGRVGHLRHPSG